MPTTWGRGKTALLVGADGGALAGIAEAIKGVGFRAITAPHGVQLNRVLDDEHVVILYVDAETIANAIGVLRELRAKHAEVPAILVRVSPSPIDVADAMRAGAFDFLPAGVATQTLLTRLHEAVTTDRKSVV